MREQDARSGPQTIRVGVPVFGALVEPRMPVMNPFDGRRELQRPASKSVSSLPKGSLASALGAPDGRTGRSSCWRLPAFVNDAGAVGGAGVRRRIADEVGSRSRGSSRSCLAASLISVHRSGNRGEPGNWPSMRSARLGLVPKSTRGSRRLVGGPGDRRRGYVRRERQTAEMTGAVVSAT